MARIERFVPSRKVSETLNYQKYGSKTITFAASGGTISTIDGKRVHTFTSVGSNSITFSGDGLIDVYMWGGGGGAGNGNGTGGAGGAGGYSFGTMHVKDGQTLIAFVGGGGDCRAAGAGPGTRAAGGGGLCGNLGYGGNGGGYSGIFSDSVSISGLLLLAGGGGGGAWEGAIGGNGGFTTANSGGAGSNGNPGGGSQTAGGAGVGGAGSGSFLQGGDCGASGDSGGGGAGGGGLFGGGAGSGNANGDGGGGGSSYAHSSLYSWAISKKTSGNIPLGTTNIYYSGTYGYGGATGNNVGVQGLVVIAYPV